MYYNMYPSTEYSVFKSYYLYYLYVLPHRTFKRPGLFKQSAVFVATHTPDMAKNLAMDMSSLCFNSSVV